MKYSSIDQWKSKMRTLAKQNNVDVQEMQQRYILEEFARKISKSKYRDSIIFKGGFVISAILGIDERKTRDIDFTFSSIIYSIEQIRVVVEEIINTDIEAFFDYEVISIREEQMDDHYSGFCCMIDAIRDKTRLHMKLDISNNTLVYPKGIDAKLHSFVDEDDIDVLSYSIENIIAEKYETTLDRGEFNTRIRDLFDVHYMFTNNRYIIEDALLSKTIIEVSKDRKTYNNLFNFEELIFELLESKIFNDNFKRYKKNNYVYKDDELIDIFSTFKQINELVQKELK